METGVLHKEKKYFSRQQITEHLCSTEITGALKEDLQSSFKTKSLLPNFYEQNITADYTRS